MLISLGKAVSDFFVCANVSHFVLTELMNWNEKFLHHSRKYIVAHKFSMKIFINSI